MLRTVLAVYRGVDPAIEEAALMLGASPSRTLLHVTLPLIRPGIVAGSLLRLPGLVRRGRGRAAAVLAESMTLPVAVLNYIAYNYDPAVAAISLIKMAMVIGVAGAARGRLRPRPPDADSRGAMTGALAVRGIVKRYGSARRCRRHRRSTCAPASSWRCSARRAAARRRLLRCIAGLADAEAGDVLLDGRDDHRRCRRGSATSAWCSRATRCSRT